MAVLSFIGRSIRPAGAFSPQVVKNLLGAIALLTFSLGPTLAADITDVTLRSGPQLKEHFNEVVAQPNVRAAVRYFDDRKLSPDVAGLTELTFRVEKDHFDLFFIPFSEPIPQAGTPQQRHLALSATGPKGNQVLLGAISTEVKPPELKEENVVVDGKVQPGNGRLKNVVKCSLLGCVPAGLGCLYGGPSWAPCFCLWCGGAVATCSLSELF
jgi:hypothetical protein